MDARADSPSPMPVPELPLRFSEGRHVSSLAVDVEPLASGSRAEHTAPDNRRDPFVATVSSCSSSEVNPYLWEWQAESLDAWHQADCRGVIEAVTGSGKTMIGITAAFEAFRQGIKVLVLVPTAELQAQWQRRLLETLPQAAVGTLGNGRHDSLGGCDVLVAIINSATRESLLNVHSEGLLIADECHRYAAPTFANALHANFKYRLGLTATYRRPDNADAEVLDPYFGGVVFQLWYDRALSDGVIAEFDVAFVGVKLTDAERAEYQAASASVSKLGMSLKTKLELQHAPYERFARAVQRLAARKNDQSPVAFMARKYLEAVVNRQKVLTNAKHKLEVLKGIAPVIAESRGTIVFSQTVDSSTRATDVLMSKGIETRAVSSESKPYERRGALQLFASGIAKALCAPRILDEGIDVPDSDLAVVLSGSKQPRQTVQRLGRVIRRKKDGRHGRFVVLFATNTIEDEERNWDQQFGSMLPHARRIAEFHETQQRELRRFLRGSPDDRPNADDADTVGSPTPAQLLIPFEPSGSENASDGVVTPEIPRNTPRNQSSVVLLKDEDDEPLEQLSWLPETDDLVRVYLNQIAQYSLLSAEQEVECAMRIEAGLFAKYLHGRGKYSTRRERHDLEGVVADGDEAFDQMVCANLRLVVSVAKRYSGRKMAFLDLIQEGNLGLVRAVQKFDYTKGNKFSTYAMWWIRQSITRGLADFSNTIRLPVHVVETLPDYLTCNATEESKAACSHDHSLAESALRMQPLSLESYLEMQWSTHYRDSISTIDDRIIDPGMFTDHPEQVLLETEWVAKVNHLVDTLPEREAEIIRRRFGWYDDEPQTLDLIGQHFNVTRERIRQLEKKSLEHLREIVEASAKPVHLSRSHSAVPERAR